MCCASFALLPLLPPAYMCTTLRNDVVMTHFTAYSVAFLSCTTSKKYMKYNGVYQHKGAVLCCFTKAVKIYPIFMERKFITFAEVLYYSLS